MPRKPSSRPVSSYTVSVGNAKPVRVKTVRDARSVVAEAITSMMARDPEAVARDASTVNVAWTRARPSTRLPPTAPGR